MPNGWKGKLEEIQGIGPAHADDLRRDGIGSVSALLKKGATRAGRLEMAKATGLSEARILQWVNHADLIRIKGVGSQYADLLEQSGVDSVANLAGRNPRSLHQILFETNERRNLVGKVPNESQVKGWVRYAKSLKKVVQS